MAFKISGQWTKNKNCFSSVPNKIRATTRGNLGVCEQTNSICYPLVRRRAFPSKHQKSVSGLMGLEETKHLLGQMQHCTCNSQAGNGAAQMMEVIDLTKHFWQRSLVKQWTQLWSALEICIISMHALNVPWSGQTATMKTSGSLWWGDEDDISRAI